MVGEQLDMCLPFHFPQLSMSVRNWLDCFSFFQSLSLCFWLQNHRSIAGRRSNLMFRTPFRLLEKTWRPGGKKLGFTQCHSHHHPVGWCHWVNPTLDRFSITSGWMFQDEPVKLGRCFCLATWRCHILFISSHLSRAKEISLWSGLKWTKLWGTGIRVAHLFDKSSCPFEKTSVHLGPLNRPPKRHGDCRWSGPWQV